MKRRSIDGVCKFPVIQSRYQESEIFFVRDVQMSIDEVLKRCLLYNFMSFRTRLNFCFDLLFSRLLGLLGYFLFIALFNFLGFVRNYL